MQMCLGRTSFSCTQQTHRYIHCYIHRYIEKGMLASSKARSCLSTIAPFPYHPELSLPLTRHSRSSSNGKMFHSSSLTQNSGAFIPLAHAYPSQGSVTSVSEASVCASPQRRGHLEARRRTNRLSYHPLHVSNIPPTTPARCSHLRFLPNERKLQHFADHFCFSIRSASCDKLEFNIGRSSEHVSERAALRPMRKLARSQRMASKAESYHLFQCMQVTHTLFLTTSAFRHSTAFLKSLHFCRSVLRPNPSQSLLLQLETFQDEWMPALNSA